MKNKNSYFVEMTDTYGGEANYSWVNRFVVSANTVRGAMRKVTNETGYYTRKDYETGEMSRYSTKSGGVCFFVEESDGTEETKYNRVKKL